MKANRWFDQEELWTEAGWQKYDIMEVPCPHCGEVCNAATGDDLGPPDPGCIIVCAGCGGMSYINDKWKLVSMDDEMWASIGEEAQRLMLEAQRLVVALNAIEEEEQHDGSTT